MTPEERALLDAVCDDPDGDAPRLAYAAWLEAQSEPWGEVIRLAVDIHGKVINEIADLDERLQFLEDERRVKELIAQQGALWKKPVLAIATSCALHRGLVASATVPAQAFVDRGAELFRLAPVVHVGLRDVRGALQPLLASPELGRIRALTLAGEGLRDEHLQMLAGATGFDQLWYLDLRRNQITVDGVQALAASPNFPQLSHVELGDNPAEDLHERCELGMAVVDTWMLPAGKRLEERIGAVRWLHYPNACWTQWPIDPCGPALV